MKESQRRYNQRRRIRHVIYGHLYRRVKTVECFYCKIMLNKQNRSKDHVYPLAALENTIRKKRLIPGSMLLLVDSCKPCNTMLGGKVHRNMEERLKIVIQRRIEQQETEVIRLQKQIELERRVLDNLKKRNVKVWPLSGPVV